MMNAMRARLPFVLFGLLVGLVFNAVTVLAWTGPTASAPNNNVSAPINVGTTNQVKSANLGVNGLAAYGNIAISPLTGTGGYLNFDYTSGGTSGSGSSGYGMRDNAGTLEFKNTGGTWQTLQTIINNYAGGGSSQWTTSGSNIYNGNAGNVGIGNTGPSYKLDVTGAVRVSGNIGANGTTPSYPITANGAAANWTAVLNWPPGTNDAYGLLVGHNTGRYSQFQNGGYYVIVANDSWGINSNANILAAAYYYNSDKRLKENIIPYENGLQKVMQLKPVTFDWNSGIDKGKKSFGFIAQEVQNVEPLIVTADAKTGYLSVDYVKVVPILVKAMQEQQAQIDELKARLAQLQAKL